MRNEITVVDSFESVLDGSAGIIDTTIDLLKEDAAKSIPFVSIAAAVYHIGKTIHERHHLNKLIEFVAEIEAGAVDQTKRKQYITEWHADRKRRESELEYLIVVIDRFLHKDMARMLAKVYLAYLARQITWREVLSYSAVIDRLLPGDYEALERGNQEDVDFKDAEDTVLRLVGLGLMVAHGKDVSVSVGTLNIPATSNSDYNVTDFGKKFMEIIG